MNNRSTQQQWGKKSQMHMLSKELSLKEYILYDSNSLTWHSLKGKTIATDNRAVVTRG